MPSEPRSHRFAAVASSIILAVALLGPDPALHRARGQTPADPRIADLAAAADARIAAMVAADPSALAGRLSSDLRYAHSNGVVDSRESFLDLIASGRSKYLAYETLERTFSFPTDGIALEAGKARIRVESASGMIDNVLSYLATWRREDGQWRFLAWQSARMPQPAVPSGFTPLFNGVDLAGWRGRPHFDPAAEAALSPEERAAKQTEWNADMAAHWKVEGGEIVSDGHGVFLTTMRDYGDFELHLEWLLPQPCADSGIYLRGNPQVQIWDPDCERDFKHGADKGSGGLWNNPADSAGRFPLVRADAPTGQWNTMRIRMQGERVSVTLNGRLVVDDQTLANFFAKGQPLPASGPIQIQTHGAPMRVRNVCLRELTGLEGSGPGWRELTADDFENVNGTEGTWTWNGGLAHCTGRPVGVIRTKRQVKNLELSVEWRHLTSAGNSGVFLWAPPAVLENLPPGRLPPGGIEVQVLDHGYTAQFEESSGKKADWFTTDGDVFPVGSSDMTPFPPVAPGGKRSFPSARHSRGTPEWNHYYVRAINGEVRLWVNGHEVSGGRDCKPAEGYLCLESEGAPVDFRRLRIRELP
ncbi:MAG: family 16 glycoside hydrolase [Pirellulales bacterium]